MRTVVGVMGGSRCDAGTELLARALGGAVAEAGWTLLCGGRDAGVMRAAAQGASESGGLVIGVSPREDWKGLSPAVDVAILTGMGDGRNWINALSGHAMVALPGGAGTLSEIALARKAGRPICLLGWPADPLPGLGLLRFDSVPELVAELHRRLDGRAVPDGRTRT